MNKLDQFTLKEVLRTLKDFFFYLCKKIFDFNERSISKLMTSFLFFSLSFVSLFVVLNSSWRQNIRNALSSFFERPYRKILSASSSYLFSDERYFKIFKVRTHQGLFLEIYGHLDSQRMSPFLFDRFSLSKPQNGYIDVKYEERGQSFFQSVGLFIEDVDGDRNMEIIVPTFKKSLEAHLDVYTYNFQNEKFEKRVEI